MSHDADGSAYSLTFLGPMYAFITLFIHILRFPDQPSVRLDISMLTICSGHFARLEFATDSEISFPFVTEVAALARRSARFLRPGHPSYLDGSSVGTQDDPGRSSEGGRGETGKAGVGVGFAPSIDNQMNQDYNVSVSPF